MGPPTGERWAVLESVDDGLTGAGFTVRGRIQDRDDQLWINIQSAAGWTYLVVDRAGGVLVSETAQTKREAYSRATEAAYAHVARVESQRSGLTEASPVTGR